jgi:hypothetical protein
VTSPVAVRLVGSGVGVKSSRRVGVGVAVGDGLGRSVVNTAADDGDGEGVCGVAVQAGTNMTASSRSRPTRRAFTPRT